MGQGCEIPACEAREIRQRIIDREKEMLE